ncbi:MAG TPA: hypothetical protein PLL24_07450, partial [Thiobacillaceae bacterium]|nr:hypothetical protein [Thiobacillaceae bacterium]
RHLLRVRWRNGHLPLYLGAVLDACQKKPPQGGFFIGLLFLFTVVYSRSSTEIVLAGSRLG